MKPLFPDHLYKNWQVAYNLPPGPERDSNMWFIKRMTKSNLHWLIRRLIGGIPSDGFEWCEAKIAAGEMCPPNEFIRKKRYENFKRKNK